MERQQYYNRPITLQIDYNQAVWQSFLNCINSFQGLETEAEMTSSKGGSRSEMTSHVSLERFLDNLGVLKGLLRGQFDREFETAKAEEPLKMKDINKDPFDYWSYLVKLLRDNGFFKQPRREAHL